MAPKKAAPELTQAAMQKYVRDSIAEALRTERATVAAAAEAAATAEAARLANAAEAAATAEAARLAAAAEAAATAEAARLATAAEAAATAEAARLAAAAGIAGGSGVRSCSYKDFKSGDPTKFKGTEGATAMVRWFEKMESVFLLCNCPDDCKVKFATSTLLDGAMSWWNSYAQPMGMENAYKLTWEQFKGLLTKKYCPRTEVKKLETEFYELVTVGYDIETYIRRFQELAALCPSMVSDNEKLLEAFIGGLPQIIQGDVISFDPQTIEGSIRVSQKLMAQVVKGENNNNKNNNNNNQTSNNKRKWENDQGGYNNDNQNCNTNHHQQQNRRQEVARVYVAAPTKGRAYTGNLPRCHQCTIHHNGPCGICFSCHKVGHLAKDCKGKAIVTCYGCGEQGHYQNQCPQNQGQQVEGALGKAYMLEGGEAQQDFNNAED